MKSFVNPLIEETHADLLSSITTMSNPPVCEVYMVKQSIYFNPPKALYYDISCINNGYSPDTRIPVVGDVIAFTDVRPKCIADLNRPKWPYYIAFVAGVRYGDTTKLSIMSSKPIVFGGQTKGKAKNQGKLFAVSLTNLTTNIRIWNALEGENMNIIRRLLQVDSAVRFALHFLVKHKFLDARMTSDFLGDF